MDKGFILTHRKIMDNPIWCDPNYYKLWSYCLFKASYCDRSILIGTQSIDIKRGQFVTGRKALSDDMNNGVKPRMKLSEKSWERGLKLLEKLEMLTIKTTNKYTVVTIVNYDFYQSVLNHVDQQVDQKVTNKRPTDDQQLTTNKELKELKALNKNLIVEIVNYLNEKSDSNFKATTKDTKEKINARLDEKYKLEDFKTVIDYCCREWKGKVFKDGRRGDIYLRPSTLFNGQFDERLNLAKKNLSYKESEPIKSTQEMPDIGDM